MSQFEQLEQYKQLLDEGVITEEEFRKIKQKILGLKTDEEKDIERQQKREEALKEIEQMRAESEKAKAAEEWEILQTEQRRNYQNLYEETRAKEIARLEVLEKQKQEAKEKQKETVVKGVKTVGRILIDILLWIVTVFMLFVTIGSFGGFEGVFGIVLGTLSLILTIFACPLVRKMTINIDKLKGFYKYKKLIVILLVIIYFVIIIAMPQ